MTTTADGMYENAYHRVNAVLDRALGHNETDGAGEGIAGDVALLAQRYGDLKRAVQSDRDGDWAHTLADIETRELRDEWWQETDATTAPVLTIEWVNDDWVQIRLGAALIIDVNTDEDGSDGMRAAMLAAGRVAKAFGATVEIVGTSNLDVEL